MARQVTPKSAAFLVLSAYATPSDDCDVDLAVVSLDRAYIQQLHGRQAAARAGIDQDTALSYVSYRCVRVCWYRALGVPAKFAAMLAPQGSLLVRALPHVFAAANGTDDEVRTDYDELRVDAGGVSWAADAKYTDARLFTGTFVLPSTWVPS